MCEYERVEHPPYYQDADGSGIECADAMKAMVGDSGYRSNLKCNILKYVWRAGEKPDTDPVEDLEKAKMYADMLIEQFKEDGI